MSKEVEFSIANFDNLILETLRNEKISFSKAQSLQQNSLLRRYENIALMFLKNYLKRWFKKNEDGYFSHHNEGTEEKVSQDYILGNYIVSQEIHTWLNENVLIYEIIYSKHFQKYMKTKFNITFRVLSDSVYLDKDGCKVNAIVAELQFQR